MGRLGIFLNRFFTSLKKKKKKKIDLSTNNERTKWVFVHRKQTLKLFSFLQRMNKKDLR